MFNYVADISALAQHIITNFLKEKNIAVDATLGNGHDTDYLSANFNSVYAFDIQKDACDKYIEKDIKNVKVINASHHLFNEYITEDIDCIMYNLGFLPGGNKEITTKSTTSMESIITGLNKLKSGGIVTICIYKGHDEGKNEATCILEYLESLPRNEYGVMVHSYLNRAITAPMLVVVEKK